MAVQNGHGAGGYAVPMVVRENQLVLLGSKGEIVPLPLRGPEAVVALAPFRSVDKKSGSGSHSGTTRRVRRTATSASVSVQRGVSSRAGFKITITYGVALLAADGRILHLLSGNYLDRDVQAAAAALGLGYVPDRIEDNDALLATPEVRSNIGAVLPEGRRRFADIAAKVAVAIPAAVLALAVFLLTSSVGWNIGVCAFLGLLVGLPLYWWAGQMVAWRARSIAARRVTAAQLRS